MQIIVLDGYTLNPGDLSWKKLEALGDLTIYARTPPDQVVPRAEGAPIVLTNKTIVSRASIEALGTLQYIGVLATGYNIVDVEAARERSIPVSNVPTYGTRSVAQMVFAHLLTLTQHVVEHAQTVREGRWAASDDFCYWDYPLVELDGLVMGIVGFGRIGQATAQLALAFGMQVLAYNPRPKPAESGVRFTDLETLLKESDVVSLHCPLVSETEGLIGPDQLALMKKSALLINTSRGPLIDEQALADALASGQIAGAGLDVLATEPPEQNHPLYEAENCYITPHIAWATRASRSRLLDAAIQNVAAYLSGNPQNVVNL